MNFLLLWLLSSGSYVALVWGLARWLPARSYPLLRLLHWLTLGLGLLISLAPLLTWGSWTPRLVAVPCLLLLASGLLAGIRGGLGLPRAAPLSLVQAGLVGVVAPLLLGFGLDGAVPDDVVYSDRDFTVTVNSHSSFQIDDLIYTDVDLYRTRGVVFEEHLGRIFLRAVSDQPTTEQKNWWRGVSALSYNADSSRGVARHGGVGVPFEVSRPYRRSEVPEPAPVAEPAPPPPPDENRVYTYVDEMPQIPGTSKRMLQEGLIQGIQAWLVLPPDVREGRIWLSLIIDKSGEVRNPRIERGLNASTDSAVLAAARQLPPLIPGRQNGKVMHVSITLSISIYKPQARRHRAARP